MKIFHKTFIKLLLIPALLFLLPNHALSKGALNFSLLVFNGEQRQAYLNQVKAFEREYPGIKVNMIAVESEEYKGNIESWLQADRHSDVMFWFGGERLNWYIKRNWITALNEVQGATPWLDLMTKSALSAVSIDQKIYGLPIHYYHWALYYKKSVFKRLNLTPPQNWDQFIAVCETLKRNNISPIALGSKEVWTVASWFDYLNLRINGLPFHRQLVSGTQSYQSEETTMVFSTMQQMLQADYFLENHEDLTWRDSLPYLYRDRAGMLLMGNFWTSQIPDSLRQDISMFRFPQMNAQLPLYEEAPTDVLVIPANVVNKKNAVTFLNFMARPEVQQQLNSELGMLPPQRTPPLDPDHFILKGAEILNAAAGASHYYDRDNPQPIATEGMEQMQRFLAQKIDQETLQEELEMIRLQTFHSEL